jgi:hypothetical protein
MFIFSVTSFLIPFGIEPWLLSPQPVTFSLPLLILHQFLFLLILFAFDLKLGRPISGTGVVTKWQLPPISGIEHRSFYSYTFSDTKIVNQKFHTSGFTKSACCISLCIVFLQNFLLKNQLQRPKNWRMKCEYSPLWKEFLCITKAAGFV